MEPAPERKCWQDPVARELRVAKGGDLALRLLERAESHQRDGIPPFSRVRTGLPTFDEAVSSWWGLTVLCGDAGSGKTVLGARVALETARAGGNVLWLCLGGHTEGAVLRLLTGMARVPARAVFIEGMKVPDKARMSAAADELGRLPLWFADAHGATAGELLAVTRDASKLRPLELVVIDGVAGAEARSLSMLGRLAEELAVPVLAIATTGGTVTQHVPWSLEGLVLPLRTGSLAIALVPVGPEERPASGMRPMRLELRRVRDPFSHSVELDLDWRCRWLEERHREP